MNKLMRLAVLATLGWLMTPANLWSASATLTPLKGSVYVQHPHKDLWETVTKPVAVEEGDRIKTNIESMAFMILPDDHRVAINSDTFIVLEHIAEGETKIYLKAGSIRNKVRHLHMDLGQYYKIQTPTAVCAVRGTDFSVLQNLQARMANVHVFEGMVDLSALKKDVAATVTHLEAGHSAAMDSAGKVQPVTPTATPDNTPPAASGNHPEKKEASDKPDQAHNGKPPMNPPTGGTATGPQGQSMPPATGTSPNGAAWFDHPESINPGTFKPTSDLPLTGPNGALLPPVGAAGATANAGVKPPTDGQNPPTTGGVPGTYSFNPMAGTGMGMTAGGTTPTNPTGPGGTTNLLNPPPTGNNPPPPTTNATALGNQALFDTVNSMNLMNQLQGLQVADLFKDGSVKIGPDGQMHLYADAVQSMGSDGVMFLNSTMLAGQPNTLNYQIAKIKFNQNLPATASAYTIATQTAFRSDFGTTPPAYYATDVGNYRSNTVDYVNVTASQGHPVLQGTSSAQRFETVFDQGQCTVNGVQLWKNNSGVYTYIGGSHPAMNFSSTSGVADSALNNTYGTSGINLGRHVTYYDPNTGQRASSASVPTTGSLSYLSGPDLLVQDTLYSNLFTKGPITSFGTSQSRIFGGIDSIVNPQDANAVLNGAMPTGMPDGLIHS